MYKKATIEKYGSKEAVYEHYKAMQQKSMLNPSKQKGNHKGGFNYMTKEQLKDISKRALDIRYNRTTNEKTNKTNNLSEVA